MERDRPIQMSGTVYGDAQTPTIRRAGLCDDGGELAAMDAEGGGAESEIAAGLEEDTPAFIQGGRGLERALELPNGEIAAQDATEHSAEDDVPRSEEHTSE